METVRLHHNAKTHRQDRWLRGIGKGLSVFVVTGFLLISLFVMLILNGILPEDSVGSLSRILFGMAILIGAWTSAKQTERGKLPAALSAALLCLALAAAITCFVNREGEQSLLKPLVIAAVCGVVGGIAGSKRKQLRYK